MRKGYRIGNGTELDYWRSLRHIALWGIAAFASISLSACDKGRALAVTSCALADGKLSVAFRNPSKARAYLVRLGERLREREDAAILEAVDLVERVARCTE